MIERVDSQQGPCGSGRHFPPEKLLPEVHQTRAINTHDRMSGRFQGIDGGILLRNGPIRVTDIHKHTIVAVDVRDSQRFIIDRNEARSFFPRTLGNQLFQPGTQIADRGRGDKRHLVMTGFGQRAQDHTQRDPGIVRNGYGRIATLAHAFGLTQESLHVHPHRGGRHHAKVG